MKEELENIEVSLIKLDSGENSPLLLDIVDTINSYLLKNRGVASDFNLIKDIVERHCDTIDEEINQKIPVPLYLGLMGTVLGIIIGLFALNPNVASTDFLYSIHGLIDGVKYAMICSLFGLTLTTILSAWFYRNAKAKIERQKNEFYSFIQIELLPQLSQNAASTILTMQANLQRFNESFEQNVNSFGNIMDKILVSFDSQVLLAEDMKNMDIATIAKLNVNVMAELKSSMKEFEKFNTYLSQMNEFVLKTAKLTDSIDSHLKRTDDVKIIVKSLEDSIARNNRVMQLLSTFLQRVNENTAITTASADLDNAMSTAVGELRAHVENQIQSIKDYTTSATDELQALLNADRGNLDRLKNLDELDRLVSAIEDMKNSFKEQNKQLGGRIDALSSSIYENAKASNGAHQLGVSSIQIKVTLLLVSIAAIFFIVVSILGLFSPSEPVNYPPASQAVFVDDNDNSQATAPDTVAKTLNAASHE